jgi:OLD-like protein
VLAEGELRAVVLVEGLSDQRAVETLARRLGRDLEAEGVAVVPMGGYGNIDRFLEQYGPRGLGVRLAGLYDAGEERHFRRALERAGLGADLEAAGFFSCDADLEDELTRAVGPAAMERVLAAQGKLKAFRTYQKQPAHRRRLLETQLHGFMWNRKSEYAVVLVNALELERMPQPLIRVLAHV